jgi:hypothetical protein
MPTEGIKDDPDRTGFDEHFINQYRLYLSGRQCSTLSRVDIQRIYSGVFRRAVDGKIVNSDFDSRPKHVEWMCYDIRRGYRPALFLYRGIFGDSDGGFVCSDDVLAYNAYRALGMRWVPAKIFGKPAKELVESGICLRVRDGRETFDSSIAVPRNNAQTVLGLSNNKLKKIGALEAIKQLEVCASRAAACIKAFHISGSSKKQVFYHQSLHSVAYRLTEILQAVAILLERQLDRQIRPLVRTAYELLLNFYIDWLAPDHMGLLFQGLAVLNRIERNSPDYKGLKEDIRTAFGGLTDLCQNAAEKGRLSPLGGALHFNIYGALSPVVHQDFGVTHDYAGTLESGRPDKMIDEELFGHIRVLDLVTAAIVTRLADDVGAADGQPKEWPKLSPSRLDRVGLPLSGNQIQRDR